MKMAVFSARRRPTNVATTWYRESAIEYDVGAVWNSALLLRSTTSRVVRDKAPWSSVHQRRRRRAIDRQLERCCGLDVHKETIAACVRIGGRSSPNAAG